MLLVYAGTVWGEDTKMYYINIEDDDFSEAINAIEKSGYPFPDTEMLFIDNDEVINTYDIHEASE